MPRRVVTAAIITGAIGLAGIAGSVSGAIAIGLPGNCSGNLFTWTGHGDGHSWSDPENWNPEVEAPPKSGDTAIIQGSESAEAEVEGGSEVCELTVEGSDAFLTNTDMTIEENFTWEGGEPTKAASELEGTFDVGGTSTLGKKLALAAGKLTAEGPLEIEGGTELTMASGSTSLVAEESAEIGGGVGGLFGGKTVVQSNSASEGNDNASLDVNGSLSLGGEVESSQLDLNLGPNGKVDLDGNVWTLPGLSFSRWKGGSEVDSSSEGGIIAFTNLANLLVDGQVTIGEKALLSMRDTSTLTNGEPFSAEPPGSIGLLRGAGAMEWQGGTIERHLTLAPGFRTVLDTGGIHEITGEPATLVRNEGTMDVQSGELLVDGAPGEVENWGTIEVHAGAVLACNSSDCGSGAIDNTPGAELEVVGPAPLQPPATKVPVKVLSVQNNGDIKVEEGLMLLFEGDAVANLDEGGTISGGGTLRLGEEGKANVVGETTLRDDSVLSIDGSEAELHGGTVNLDGELFTGVLNAANAGDGTLQWIDGGLEGSLLTDNQLQTLVTSAPATSRTIDAEGQDTHTPTRNPTSITLASPTHVDAATVSIDTAQNGNAVSVDGPMTIAGPAGGFTRGSSDADGVIIDSPGTITAEGATLIEAPLTVLGGLQVPASTTLNVPLGFTQSGPGAETILSGGMIDTLEEGEGELETIALNGGSLHGPGTIRANLVVPGATVSPSVDNSSPGLLSIEGDFTQQLGGTLAAHLAGTPAAQHDQLVVKGTASLAGTLAAITDAGYHPTVPTTVPDVLDAANVTGTFSNVSSSGAPANTAWQTAYRSGAVDLNLVSTGASGPGPGPGPSLVLPGFRGGHSGVRFRGGLHLSPKDVVSATLQNANSFPVVLDSSLLQAPTGGGAGKSSSKRALTIGLGNSHPSIPAGGSAHLLIPLNRRGRKLLTGKHRLEVTASAMLSAPDGSHADVSVHGVLTPPSSHQSR